MKLLLAVLATASLPSLRADPLESSNVSDVLALDDTCATGGDCDVSFRQLRGERRSAEVLQANVQAQAPQFNYNWNFGCAGSEEKQEKPQSDGSQFNYNWNFCFQPPAQAAPGGFQKKPGNCKVFGCTASFDFNTLMNECQCFPGCDKTFLGNTCCSDYQDRCHGSASITTTAAPDEAYDESKFTRYSNAACSNLHGASVRSKSAGSLQSCSDACLRDASCEGLAYSARKGGRCRLLAGINIPQCKVSDGGWSTYVKKKGDKPPVCGAYLAETGCSWTAKWSCPGQSRGYKGTAGDDGTQGYNCCCNLGHWKSTRPALPSGTPLRIINRFSNRALFAKIGRNWEDGVGAGTPPKKVTEDGYWTLIPQGGDKYRIVNQFSHRALYAKVGENWESGWGGGSPPEAVQEDGLWRLVHDELGGVRIVNVKSDRALYAKTGGAGEMSWSGGVGAGHPASAVTQDGMWTLDFAG